MRGILVREGGESGPGTPKPTRGWVPWLAISSGLAALPILAVRYPPILDLPQQLAQTGLVGRALSDPSGPYRIQWWAPDKVAYPLLAAGQWLGGDAWGARLSLLLIALAWIAGVFVLARRRRRSTPVQAALATLLLWNSTLYGGFFHFLLGILALAFWLPELTDPPASDRFGRLAARSLVGALLLYLCHALWLAAGLATLPVALALRRARAREWWARAAGTAPVALVAALWYPSLARGGWDSAVRYGLPLTTRLASPSYLVMSVFGGVAGWLEPAAWTALALWLVAGAWTARRAGPGVDRPLLGAGLIGLVAAALLPEALGATALFGPRWGWVSAVLLVLAVPPPAVRPWLRSAFVLLLLTSFSLATCVRWLGFERRWMPGFERLLEPIGAGQRLLELDFVRRVPELRGPRFFQLAAYAQVERGAEIGYSFAEAPSSLVVFRDLPAVRGWNRWLYKEPYRVSRSDLDHFDWLLVLADAGTRDELAARFPRLEERVAAGPWRLYAVGAGSGPAGGPR